MATKRSLQFAEQIHHFVAKFLLSGHLADPRLTKGLTIQYVTMSTDLQVARIYFTVLGGEERRKEALKAFKKAAGFLRRELGATLTTRYTPHLFFHFDESIDRAHKLTEAIDLAMQADHTAAAESELSLDDQK